MKRFILTAVLLLAGIDFLFAQTNCNCPSFSEAIRKQFERGISTGEPDQVKLIIDGQKNSSNPCCQAIGFALEAVQLNSKNKLAESFASARQAKSLLKDNADPYAAIESNRMMALYYVKNGNGDSAALFYFKALEIATQANEQYLVSRVCNGLSSYYSNRKQATKGLEYQQKALAAALLSKDTFTIAHAYSYLTTSYGRMYDDTENEIYVDSANQVALIALVYAKAAHNNNLIIRNYLSMEKFAIVRKQFQLAIKYIDTTQSLITEKTSIQIKMSSFIDKGVALTGLKRYDEAVENLNKAFEFVKQTKNIYQERMMYDRLYETYKAKDDPKEALQYLEKFRVLNDSLINTENSDAINEMEAKYNKFQDQQVIKDLAQQKRMYLLLAITGLLTLVALVFFIRQQSLKNKKNILETEQRLNRARMNPHFFFNALTTLQKFALRDNDGQALATNLSRFSNIMRETLESTYKEYVTVEQEMEFLNEYLEVQKIRFPKTFSYAITAADELETNELLIPSMIIQPFVENSIEHGFVGIDYPGDITIHFDKKDKEVMIQIKDNGKGLTTTPKENNEHISRASQIIKDRIYLLNIKLKTKAGFSIDNDVSGNGVVVKIHLPLLYAGEKNS